MKNVNTYNVRLVEAYGVFDDTLKLYRQAVMFFVDVIKKEWDTLKDCTSKTEYNPIVEFLTVKTKNNPNPKYNFSKRYSIGIRIAHVCARNTSRLAFDGSGEVKRGKESELTNGNYSLCEFSSGKVYHCDLNASYNIGARYYIRETLRSIPETERLEVVAKVPSLSWRSTCVLSDLKDLCAVMHASIPCVSEHVASGLSGSPMPLKGNRPAQTVLAAVGSTSL